MVTGLLHILVHFLRVLLILIGHIMGILLAMSLLAHMGMGNRLVRTLLDFLRDMALASKGRRFHLGICRCYRVGQVAASLGRSRCLLAV